MRIGSSGASAGRVLRSSPEASFAAPSAMSLSGPLRDTPLVAAKRHRAHTMRRGAANPSPPDSPGWRHK